MFQTNAHVLLGDAGRFCSVISTPSLADSLELPLVVVLYSVNIEPKITGVLHHHSAAPPLSTDSTSVKK